MVEAARAAAVVQGRGLPLQARELPLDVGDEQIGQVVTEAPFDHHTQRRKVGALLREGVGRHEPAALPEGVRDVEDRVVLDVVDQREVEDR